jgi:hypothetical protein
MKPIDLNKSINGISLKAVFRRIKQDRCIQCGRKLENQIDSITKTISPYLWSCVNERCSAKGILFSKG